LFHPFREHTPGNEYFLFLEQLQLLNRPMHTYFQTTSATLGSADIKLVRFVRSCLCCDAS
jgi:hypothetical protein